MLLWKMVRRIKYTESHSPAGRSSGIFCFGLWIYSLLLLPLPIIGCTSSTNTFLFAPETLQLPESLTAHRIPGEIPVYEIIKPGGNIRPVYATSVRECRKKLQHREAALARQLLIGLKGITIRDEEEIERGAGKFSKQEATAVSDEQTVYLISYLTLDDKCVTDVVFWSFDEDALTSLKGEALTNLASQIVAEDKWYR